MKHLDVRLLGPFEVFLDGKPVTGFESVKVRALLAYLAAEAPRPQRRDHLAGLLWPDWPQQAAAKNLRHTLSELRKSIGDRDAQPPFLVISRESIQLNLKSDCSVDVQAFERSQTADQDMQAAVRLYRGDFLEGFSLSDSPVFEDWIRAKGEYYRSRFLKVLETQSEQSIETGDYDKAMELSRHIIQIEPWHEPAHRHLMKILALQGHRVEAVAQYERLRKTLEDELHIEPSAETQALLELVRAGTLQTQPQPKLESVNVPARRNNLPAQLSSFIGRETESAEVSGLLARNRLVTLTGSGGVGKTRLMLHVAEQVLPQFPDGIWFAELAGLTDPNLVPRTLLSVLGLSESPNRLPVEQIKDHLRQKNILILLDNCEHVIADSAQTAETLMLFCPGLKIMASSRETLSIAGEITYRVPSLTVPDLNTSSSPDHLAHNTAVQLFVERAELAQPDFKVTQDNALAIIQICRRLDGIPLAIELAAARIGALSASQIAERLDDRFRLLTRGSRTALPRQQTLRASIDWSYSLLTEFEKELLMRLSVFQGGWTLELAIQVCGFDDLDDYQILDGLTGLVNKSLVYIASDSDGSVRYRRLETIRQYARQKLLDSGNSEIVHDRHLDAFVGLVEQAGPHLRGPQQLTWLDRLESELDNFRAALEWALVTKPSEGLRLATSLYWLWHLRGYRVEGERWLQQLLDQVDDINADVPSGLMSEALARQVLLLTISGQAGEQVNRKAEKSVKLADSLGVAGKQVRFLAVQALSWSAWAMGDSENTHKLNGQLLVIAEENGDRFQIAEALRQLSITESDLEKAKAYTERNLALRRELGDLDGQASSYQTIGGNYFNSGDLTLALQMYEQSTQLAKRMKNRPALLRWNYNIGRIYFESGQLEQAIETFKQGVLDAQDLGEQAWVIRHYIALGHVYGRKNDWMQARSLFDQAIDISRSSQLIYWEAISSISLAEVAWSLGDNTTAIQYYQAAKELGMDCPDLSLIGLNFYVAGKVALLQDDQQSAERYFREALKDFSGKGNFHSMGPCLEALALIAAIENRYERAVCLHGIVSSRRWMNGPFGMPWLISYDLSEFLASARAALGESRFAQWFDEGHAMSIEQAVAYALEQPGQ